MASSAPKQKQTGTKRKSQTANETENAPSASKRARKADSVWKPLLDNQPQPSLPEVEEQLTAVDRSFEKFTTLLYRVDKDANPVFYAELEEKLIKICDELLRLRTLRDFLSRYHLQDAKGFGERVPDSETGFLAVSDPSNHGIPEAVRAGSFSLLSSQKFIDDAIWFNKPPDGNVKSVATGWNAQLALLRNLRHRSAARRVEGIGKVFNPDEVTLSGGVASALASLYGRFISAQQEPANAWFIHQIPLLNSKSAKADIVIWKQRHTKMGDMRMQKNKKKDAHATDPFLPVLVIECAMDDKKSKRKREEAYATLLMAHFKSANVKQRVVYGGTLVMSDAEEFNFELRAYFLLSKVALRRTEAQSAHSGNKMTSANKSNKSAPETNTGVLVHPDGAEDVKAAVCWSIAHCTLYRGPFDAAFVCRLFEFLTRPVDEISTLSQVAPTKEHFAHIDNNIYKVYDYRVTPSSSGRRADIYPKANINAELRVSFAGFQIVRYPYIQGSHVAEVFGHLWYALLSLSTLHSQRIIHADVREANIVYADDITKSTLIDFDLSCHAVDADARQYPSTYVHELRDTERHGGADAEGDKEFKHDVYSMAAIFRFYRPIDPAQGKPWNKFLKKLSAADNVADMKLDPRRPPVPIDVKLKRVWKYVAKSLEGTGTPPNKAKRRTDHEEVEVAVIDKKMESDDNETKSVDSADDPADDRGGDRPSDEEEDPTASDSGSDGADRVQREAQAMPSSDVPPNRPKGGSHPGLTEPRAHRTALPLSLSQRGHKRKEESEPKASRGVPKSQSKHSKSEVPVAEDGGASNQQSKKMKAR